MLTGKWLMTMFETGDQVISTTEDKSDKYSYEFICEMPIKNYCQVIESFFTKNCKDTKYIIIQSDKVFMLFNFRLV